MKLRKKGHKGFFALKLDMSKAYDRVEWKFLEKIMIKLGLPMSLITLIMRCVNSVSYSILINGQPSPQFSPSRGLRQGDPLSPHLFLFYAEAFSSLIRKAETQNSIHGYKICRRAPAVSHLFFVDDNIIFGRANQQKMHVIYDILQCY